MLVQSASLVHYPSVLYTFIYVYICVSSVQFYNHRSKDEFVGLLHNECLCVESGGLGI
jgi:hypothetical protein